MLNELFAVWGRLFPVKLSHGIITVSYEDQVGKPLDILAHLSRIMDRGTKIYEKISWPQNPEIYTPEK